MKIASATLCALLCVSAAAWAQDEGVADSGRDELSAAAGAPVSLVRSRVTGAATFLGTPAGRGIPVDAGLPAEGRARQFLARFGHVFGVADPGDMAVRRLRERDEVGMDHVRMQQTYLGVPVTGAELTLHMRGGRVESVNGRTLPDVAGLDVVPRFSAAGARERVLSLKGRLPASEDAEASEPRLEIFNRGLLDGRPARTRLAWFVELRGFATRYFVWIDARTGTTLLRFDQLAHARNRKIYDGQSLAALPGVIKRTETQPPIGDQDVDLAHRYLGDTYDFFFSKFGRDSYNGAGAVLKATVRHCPNAANCPYPNAFWNGVQMVFGAGFPAADDVDAHELTHAVTEYEANLFYYMQSGALNESFSDIFGEAVDLSNTGGTDTPAVRWQMGEDVPGFGAIRNMMDPTLFGDPGKMSDPQFTCEDQPAYGDGGGVHSNSGVPNHAFALMVDGGSYNGFTITGIGLDKAARIQYRTLSQYLGSASDFLDNYNALKQSCQDLVGTSGITAGDCVEVGEALDAVEMDNTWPCLPLQAAAAPTCPAGLYPKNVFFDNLEAGAGKWVASKTIGPSAWFLSRDFATSGKLMLWGQDPPVTTNALLTMKNPVAVPATGAFMHFNHSWGFDNFAGVNYDAGVLEYSANNGPWTDAAALFLDGAAYNGTVFAGDTNPLGGRSAFIDASNGYTSTRLDLAALAGQKVKFRFRIGADSIVDDYGWFVDDVRVYTCIPPPSVSIGNAQINEGASGVKNLTFKLTLSSVWTLPVTVHWSTADDTATAAGNDYVASSGTVTIPKGVLSKTFVVQTRGDLVVEPNETFFVNLDSPVNATIGDGQGVGTILTDDYPPPTVSVDDPIGVEGNPGAAKKLNFRISLSNKWTQKVTVNYATAPGSATPGVDYTHKTGAAVIAIGATSVVVPVSILPDLVEEGDESVLLNLTGAINATIVDNQGVGTIDEDDCTIDNDGDRMCDGYETNTGVFVSKTNTGTDPTNPDTDGDGIIDGDEVLGTAAGLNLPGMGTNPLRKNILLEYDWFNDSLDCGSHSHRPTVAMLDRVAAAFAAAPVSNPDGSTGITVIQDRGQGGLFTGGTVLADGNGVIDGGVNEPEFQARKATGFNAKRHGYFHYVLMPHRYNTSSGSSGQAELPGDDLIVSLQCTNSTNFVANTIMHELGHNLNLRHGGNENCNWKPNYNSVMNYRYQFWGIDADSSCDAIGTNGENNVLDYSRGTRIDLDENSLNEAAGVCGATPIDWNFSGTITSGLVYDLNRASDFPDANTPVDNFGCSANLQTLTDFDDWVNVFYGGLTDADGAPLRTLRPTETFTKQVIDCLAPLPREQATGSGADSP